MLQDIRDKSQGIIVKVIIGVVIVTFALFGVEALVQSFTSTDTVAEVDGKEISRMQLLQSAETQRRQLISMMGGQIDPAMLEENALQRRALDELIQRTVMMNQAEQLNLGVSDAQVDAYLLQAEQFQTDGQFDQNKYLNFIFKRINPFNNYKKLFKLVSDLNADIYHFHDLWINRIGKLFYIITSVLRSVFRFYWLIK
mgnify:CR=1 FL=1